MKIVMDLKKIDKKKQSERLQIVKDKLNKSKGDNK